MHRMFYLRAFWNAQSGLQGPENSRDRKPAKGTYEATEFFSCNTAAPEVLEALLERKEYSHASRSGRACMPFACLGLAVEYARVAADTSHQGGVLRSLTRSGSTNPMMLPRCCTPLSLSTYFSRTSVTGRHCPSAVCPAPFTEQILQAIAGNHRASGADIEAVTNPLFSNFLCGGARHANVPTW